MSKIDELIQRLCPDGVGYKKLEELEDSGIIALGRGKVISKKDIQDNPDEYSIYSSSAVGSGLLGTYGDYMFDATFVFSGVLMVAISFSIVMRQNIQSRMFVSG